VETWAGEISSPRCVIAGGGAGGGDARRKKKRARDRRGEGGRGGGNEREREVGSGQPATRCWMAENVTVDAPKLNLPGNAERLIKCVRQGASRPSAALSLAISPALVFFFFFFFFFDRFRWESTAVSLSPGRLGRTDSLKPSRSSFSSS
jgi:hypothetical protein